MGESGKTEDVDDALAQPEPAPVEEPVNPNVESEPEPALAPVEKPAPIEAPEPDEEIVEEPVPVEKEPVHPNIKPGPAPEPERRQWNAGDYTTLGFSLISAGGGIYLLYKGSAVLIQAKEGEKLDRKTRNRALLQVGGGVVCCGAAALALYLHFIRV